MFSNVPSVFKSAVVVTSEIVLNAGFAPSVPLRICMLVMFDTG